MVLPLAADVVVDAFEVVVADEALVLDVLVAVVVDTLEEVVEVVVVTALLLLAEPGKHCE